ncbi:type IV pilus modification PilV family protein [Coraliomargarita parva]|uniref:type IV pilus modification PilV family protein n=1 Tax=Coraliomargarita parva TaxID=3014050 RepID=UPI0022B4DCB2|nr:prepilin-type N-terminal cleavage/methylation domain-containing protein [Coraliomargarita parva]
MNTHPKFLNTRQGFSLIEVVLALGIFLVTILALVGLLGPTLKNVDEVEATDEVSSVVNTLNAFLHSSPDIAKDASKFDAIYNLVKNNDYAEIYVFRAYNTNNTAVDLQIGFSEAANGTVGTNSLLQTSSFADAAGPIYRIILTASPVTPDQHLTDPTSRNSDGVYLLEHDLADYDEGFFAMEVRIFAREKDMAAVGGNLPVMNSLSAWASEEPIFTYNAAIVR